MSCANKETISMRKIPKSKKKDHQKYKNQQIK